jgi:NAD(P)-dependent dehydrogenase (short-subunit alcohol dehydrogenase family)
MHYAVVRTDERFRIGTIQVGGSRVEGFIEAYMRPEPVTQPSAAQLRSLVARDEFCSSNALVIGGSRGLGELTAKLLAAGGATVILTYAVGAADAEKLVAEITEAGGKTRAIRFQVGASVQKQLRDLPPAIDCVYYFASPRIFGQGSGLFDSSRFEDFSAAYAAGFFELCSFFATTRRDKVSVFYPSSVAVETRPRGMTEYAMAKPRANSCVPTSTAGCGASA